jgi:hypothetical protein
MSLIGIIASSKLGVVAPTSVDYLVVAGGAGGGNGNSGGGGGAGGYRSGSAFSIGASFTVTVGAGGAVATNGNNSVLAA